MIEFVVFSLAFNFLFVSFEVVDNEFILSKIVHWNISLATNAIFFVIFCLLFVYKFVVCKWFELIVNKNPQLKTNRKLHSSWKEKKKEIMTPFCLWNWYSYIVFADISNHLITFLVISAILPMFIAWHGTQILWLSVECNKTKKQAKKNHSNIAKCPTHALLGIQFQDLDFIYSLGNQFLKSH